MDRSERAKRRRFLCHACGYDMAGRGAGDPCPECATAFDRRPDLPGAEARSKRGIAYTVGAIVLWPVLPPLTVLLFYLAHRVFVWLDPEGHDFRIPYHIRRRRRTMELLVFVFFGVFVASLWIDELWPPFMDWVGFGL